MATDPIDDEVDKFTDVQLGMILSSFLGTGDALAKARAASGGDASHGVSFVIGLWIGVVAAKEPKYGPALRRVLAKVQARTTGKTEERVEAEALQMLGEALKGTIFES
jgi:hypothetical protein